jgi:hypothetical protein
MMQGVFPIRIFLKSPTIQKVTGRVTEKYEANHAGENLQERGGCLQRQVRFPE